ncbi:MAG: AbrB/MazE/SpoVT family DNA-binding domain-containing protein [Patescibacteria group bacterium]
MQPLINSRHQIVIPREVRKKAKALKPGRRVNVIPVDEETITIKVAPKSWVEETYGMMREAWKDIDPIAELEKMRDEWDQKEKDARRGLK